MVMRSQPKNQSSRNLLPYFLESSIWQKHVVNVVDNYGHWVLEDPIRARRMYEATLTKKKGYTVQEYLYDMIECLFKAKLNVKTKQRLYTEIDIVEQWHEENGTLLEVM